MKNLYKEIKKLKQKRSALKVIKNYILPIGTIVINENKVEVYVCEELLNKYIDEKIELTLTESENVKINYIFSNININKCLKINGNGNDCTFKNCVINNKVSIENVHNLYLIDNMYSSSEEIQFYFNDKSLITGNVDNLVITRNNNLLDMDINVKNGVDILYSNLFPYDYGKIKLKAKSINIIHSRISNKLILDSNEIFLINSITLYKEENKTLKRNKI